MRKKEILQFFDSKYYDLKDVHTFNLFIDSIVGESTADIKLAKELIEADSKYLSKDELKDVVPNTQKYIAGLEKMMRARVAKAFVKEHDLKSEVVCVMREPKWRTLKRYTFKLGHPAYEAYDRYEDYAWWVDAGNKEYVFFTIDKWPEEVVEDLNSLKYGYTRDEHWEKVDLIAEHLKRYNRAAKLNEAHELAERIGVTCAELKSVFDIEKLHRWSGGWSHSFLTYENDGDAGENAKDVPHYSYDNVQKLVEEAKVAREQKYVKDDKFVEYPSHTPYVDFKKMLAQGEYNEYAYD